MHKIVRILMLMLTAALVACGGGGGSSGANPNQSTLVTTAGDSVVIPVDGVRDFQISGGVPPYRVANTAQAIALAVVSGTSLRITGVAAGTTTVSVIDYKGTSTEIKVQIGSSVELSTTAPSPVQMANGSTISTYTIAGGRAPYTVTSSDVNIARATVEGNRLAITGVGFGSTQLTISDMDAKTLRITVNVGASQGLFTDAPRALTIPNERLTRTYTITGGSAPYTAKSSDERIVRASVSGQTLKLESIGFGAAEVVISDKDSSTIAISVSVKASQNLFTTAPSPVYIVNGESRDYQITGGSLPYTATSTDLTVATASVNGSVLSIAAVGPGKTTITVSDGDSVAKPIEVNVGSSTSFFLNAPADVTLGVGVGESYLLNGGTTPYVVNSSNSAVATGSIVGTTLTVNPLKVGSTTLRVADAAGKSQTLKVTVVADTVDIPVSADPQLRSAGLIDSAGNTTNAIGASGYTTLNVTLTDPSGRPLPNQLIDVSGDSTKLTFPEGTAGLTDAAGVARIKLARASLTAMGAGSLTVTFNYKAGTLTTYPDGSRPPTTDTKVSTYVGYQLATANVSLVNLNVGAATLPAYGTRTISVQAQLNGSPAIVPVQVNFSATCGQISPATVSTNSSGVATVSYSAVDAAGATQSTQGCSGKSVEISASTIGATVQTKTLTIQGAPATNMSFVGAAPERIYLANSGGATQSVVVFKLVNARGEAIIAEDVLLTLKTLNGGIPKASFGTVGNTATITSTTDAKGEVSVPVFSGTVPTNVLVNAALKSNPSVQSDSAVLTIASGRAAQARTSFSVEKFAIEGANVDGDTSNVTMSLADRQGNPVPDGTAVNFVTSGGVMIPPVCTTKDSQCVVKIRSQNPRNLVSAPGTPATQKTLGRVFILAYAAGEEDFVDANFNNVYDCGEAFTDLGTAYRDNNLNAAFDTGEFSVPRAASASSCATATAPSPQRGDGVWGAADVRAQHTMVFATSTANITGSFNGTGVFNTRVSDLNDNSMPTGTEITITATDATGANELSCTVASGAKMLIPNTFDPITTSALLKDCAIGDVIGVEVKTPMTKTVTQASFRIQ